MLAASRVKAQVSLPTLSQAKTYVLVHGAYGGSWIWRDVAEGLRKEGDRKASDLSRLAPQRSTKGS